VTEEICGLSSMATRQLLTELCGLLGREHGLDVAFTSAGGVEVARRVREGAEADLLVLAEAAMAALDAEGLLVGATLRPLFVSEVVAAVPASAAAAPLAAEGDLRAALVAAGCIAYSTGPSGTALLALVERWGLTEEVGARLVQAPPGVPVGSLLAEGRADLGFQQRSELTGVPGVQVLGPLPGAAAIRSTFSGAVLAASRRPAAAARALDLLVANDAASVVRACGMEPVRR